MWDKTTEQSSEASGEAGASEKLSVFVVSDARLFRESLISFLESLPEILVAGSASNAAGALKRMVPQIDTTLVDMSMRGALGLCRDLLADRGKVVALGVTESEERMTDCAMLGLQGYVSRVAGAEDIASAIFRVCANRVYCDAATAELAVSCVAKLAQQQAGGAMPFQTEDEDPVLTRRELQIARLIAEGLANKDIARQLRIEVSTVKNHVHNVLGKYGARSRTEAAFRFNRLLKKSGLDATSRRFG